MTTKLTRALTDDEIQKRDWSVTVNGVVVPDAREVQITNERRGLRLHYGMRPEGYDGVYVDQPFGSVILPYTIHERVLFVGLVKQERVLQGGNVWNAIRGLIDVNETHLEAAKREFIEEFAEAGIDAKQLAEPRQLSGSAVNVDSAFFNTPNSNTGVQFFSVKIPEKILEMNMPMVSLHDANFKDTDNMALANIPLRFKKDLVVPKTRMGERIFSACFFPANLVMQMQDGMTIIAVARLLVSEDDLLEYF